MKKVISIATAAMVLSMLMPVAAMAHGHGHGHGNRGHCARQTYSVCAVEDCVYAQNHIHDGVTYAPHHSADGHSYHNVNCPVVVE